MWGNTSSTWYLQDCDNRVYGMTVINAAIMVLVLTANLLNLYIFSCFRNFSNQYRYMLALAIGDLLTLIPACFILIAKLLEKIWLTSTICNILGVLTILPFQLTVGMQTAMTLDKSSSILWPAEYKIRNTNGTHRRGTTILKIIFISLIPPVTDFILIGADILVFYFEPYLTTCYIDWRLGSILALSPYFVIPLIVQFVANGYILYKMSQLQRRHRRRVWRASSVVVITVILFYCAWVPQALYNIWAAAGFSPGPPGVFLSWSAAILFAHSFISTFIYFFTVPQFKEVFVKLFPICQTKEAPIH